MKFLKYCTALAFLIAPQVARSKQAAIDSEYKIAQEMCSEVENGVVDKASIKPIKIDLNDDEKPDFIFNYSEITCSSSMLAFCGNGGCPIAVYVDGKRSEEFARDVQVLKVFGDFPMLVFAKHGSACNGYGAQACFSFMYWNGEDLISGTPQFEAPPAE